MCLIASVLTSVNIHLLGGMSFGSFPHDIEEHHRMLAIDRLFPVCPTCWCVCFLGCSQFDDWFWQLCGSFLSILLDCYFLNLIPILLVVCMSVFTAPSGPCSGR